VGGPPPSKPLGVTHGGHDEYEWFFFGCLEKKKDKKEWSFGVFFKGIVEICSLLIKKKEDKKFG